jgi:hypothetical protein
MQEPTSTQESQPLNCNSHPCPPLEAILRQNKTSDQMGKAFKRPTKWDKVAITGSSSSTQESQPLNKKRQATYYEASHPLKKAGHRYPKLFIDTRKPVIE